MTEQQWTILLDVIDGKKIDPLPAGFIIDSPWLPNWYGIKMLDYFNDDDLWMKANFMAIDRFPDVFFLPGFWSEFGMCSEPVSFGAQCAFSENDFPHANPVITSLDGLDHLRCPDPATDGLTPRLLKRLVNKEKEINARGHHIRFSVSRGPLNIASYLMGMTEFMMAMMSNPVETHRLLRVITDFLLKWHKLQKKTFDSIDGILLLDDIIGFIGEDQFKEYGLPYFKELYNVEVSVKFLHNDAPCRVSAPYLPELGVNLFNMGFDVKLSELKQLTKNTVTLLGNIPPRDVLAGGTEGDIKEAVSQVLQDAGTTERLILSCGGGMPPGVPTKNIESFIRSIHAWGA